MQVFSADPAAINTNWQSITAPDGQFVGDGANPEGVSVPAGSAVLVGPFPWIPTAEEAQGRRTPVLVGCADGPRRRASTRGTIRRAKLK